MNDAVSARGGRKRWYMSWEIVRSHAGGGGDGFSFLWIDETQSKNGYEAQIKHLLLLVIECGIYYPIDKMWGWAAGLTSSSCTNAPDNVNPWELLHACAKLILFAIVS